MKKKDLHRVLFAFFSFLLLLQVLLFWRAKSDASRGLADFSSFYGAAWMLRRGMGHELYDPVTQSHVQSTLFPEASTRNGLLPYIHPPFEALLYLPLTYVPYRTAYAIWVVINIFLLLAAAMILASHMTELKSLWIPLPFLLYLGYFPAFVGLLQGQDSIVLLVVFALAFVSLKEKRDFKAGAILALGLFKFQYTVPFLAPFLFWRRWKVLEGAASSTLALFLLSLPVAGFHGTISYPRYLIDLLKRSPSNHFQNALGIVSNTMPNIRGGVEMLGAGLLQPGYQKAIIILLSCAAIICAALKWQISRALPEKKFDLGFALALVVSVLVSYHVQLHDLTLLLIPFVLLLDYSLKIQSNAERPRLAVFGIIAIFFFSPLYLWLIQRGELYLLFFPILFFAGMLNHQIGLVAGNGRDHAGENRQDEITNLT